MPLKFRFRWVPFIAAMLAVALGVELGRWQTRRGDEKQAIETMLSAREAMPPLQIDGTAPNIGDIEFRHVVLHGRFDAGWPLYLENMPYQGQAGFYLLMPMQLEGSNRHVLVARGWLPRDPQDRTKLPQIATPPGTVTVEGRIMRRLPRVLQLGQSASLQPGAIVQNIQVADVAAATKVPMLPFIVEQTGGTDDHLVRDWPRPSSGIERHRGYAVQWYGLALAAFLFFIVTGFRRERK